MCKPLMLIFQHRTFGETDERIFTLFAFLTVVVVLVGTKVTKCTCVTGNGKTIGSLCGVQL